MPNTDNINRLIEAIRANPDGFDMMYWDCGTTACIGGWCDRLDPYNSAANFLGLELLMSGCLLFGIADNNGKYGNPVYDDSKPITPEVAIYALEKLRDTGVFTSWQSILDEIEEKGAA